jgi:hypothetical protein
MRARVRRAGRVALAALLVCAAAALSACEPLGPDELQREVETVHSLAAEGSVLADEIAAQNTKRTFARVQARELSDAAEHSAERLTDAHPAEGLEGPTQRAISLAEDVSSAVGSLETAPDDASAAATSADRLRELARRSDGLAASL